MIRSFILLFVLSYIYIEDTYLKCIYLNKKRTLFIIIIIIIVHGLQYYYNSLLLCFFFCCLSIRLCTKKKQQHYFGENLLFVIYNKVRVTFIIILLAFINFLYKSIQNFMFYIIKFFLPFYFKRYHSMWTRFFFVITIYFNVKKKYSPS